MALNASALGAALKQVQVDFNAAITTLLATNPHPTNADFEPLQTAMWTATAAAIIDHFKNNAEITPNGTPAMAAGGDTVTGKGKIQ